MQIMCLNGWGWKLYAELLPFIRSTVPDVLCLQEVIHSPATAKEWLTYRDGEHVLPQRANFFRDVAETLPDHIAIFCPAAQGVLWDDRVPLPSQWGVATFVRRSLPIIGQVQGFVHKTYSPDSYGDHPRSRGAHGVRVYDYEQARCVSITHMHELRDLNGKLDTPERALQARLFLELSKQLSEPDDLTVVCGDFNVEPESETVRILKNAGFRELVTSHRFSSTRTSHYNKPERFADYMLINHENAVRTFQVVESPEVSDHCPLVLMV